MRAFPLSSLIAGLAAALIVIDGDTVHTADGEKYRLPGIDAAEIGHAQCEAELRLALLTKHRLEQMLDGAEVRFRGESPPRRDRYGRVLADLIINGQDAGCILIKEGYARPWRGRREDWCAGKDAERVDAAALSCVASNEREAE
ncbi:thermonuclease family protein [Methyloligella sp. 2.7D]|uniref:thermonuclease family protein n=1 Tax=unclassified Methyloligella TaxID=2625955 RepID=UPI00157D8950|nr:thermonuclease family protein [Methyloligella sp. GL2]QKP78468.1 thermonuclease family protein [Methyloligella sp. GL2]